MFETRWIISLPVTKPPVISALIQNASPVACCPLCSLTGGHCFKIHTYKPQITCTLGPLLAEAEGLKDSPRSSSPDSCPLPGMPFSLCLGALSYSSFRARVTSNTFASCTLCQGTLPRGGPETQPMFLSPSTDAVTPQGQGYFPNLFKGIIWTSRDPKDLPSTPFHLPKPSLTFSGIGKPFTFVLLCHLLIPELASLASWIIWPEPLICLIHHGLLSS